MKITDKDLFEQLAKKMLSLTGDKENQKIDIYQDKMSIFSENFFISHQGNFCEVENNELIVIDESMEIIDERKDAFEFFCHSGKTMLYDVKRSPIGKFTLDFSNKLIPIVKETDVLFIDVKEQVFRIEPEVWHSGYDVIKYDVIRDIFDPNCILRFKLPAFLTLGIVDLSPDKKVHFEVFRQISKEDAILLGYIRTVGFVLKFTLDNGYSGFIRGKKVAS